MQLGGFPTPQLDDFLRLSYCYSTGALKMRSREVDQSIHCSVKHGDFVNRDLVDVATQVQLVGDGHA